MTKKATILRHTLIWLVFISYEFTFLRITVGIHSSLLHFILYYGLNILLFYCNAGIVLNFAFFKTGRPYLVSFFFILLEIVAYLFVKVEVDTVLIYLEHIPAKKFKVDELYIMTNVWRSVYFIGFSIAYWSLLNMLRFKERNFRMQTEQLKSIAETLELENRYISVENAYLQNQISPHLLFNSLNFIYNAIYRVSDKAGRGVMLLADLMRYSLVTGDDKRTVLLASEMIQVGNLVELSRLRFGEDLFLTIKRRGRIAGRRIIPLILITLVENMIKHGDLGEVKSPALIRLEVFGDKLTFETRNKKRASSPHPKGGLGLRNIEKRLNNFYQGQYTLSVTELENIFSVMLTINL